MNQPFNNISKKQLAVVSLLAAFKWFIYASYDFFKSAVEPSLTAREILSDCIAFGIVSLAITIPLMEVIWNRIVSPVFNLQKIDYAHAFVICILLSWFSIST